jgi:hypothetical protein
MIALYVVIAIGLIMYLTLWLRLIRDLWLVDVKAYYAHKRYNLTLVYASGRASAFVRHENRWYEATDNMLMIVGPRNKLLFNLYNSNTTKNYI